MNVRFFRLPSFQALGLVLFALLCFTGCPPGPNGDLEGEAVSEGETATEGEGEAVAEGETATEGEGEAVAEGETATEGEGEAVAEGETITEGEGEAVAEGEGEPGPVVLVTPAVRRLSGAENTALFDVSNAGVGTLHWSALVPTDDWLSITSAVSGTDAGSITVTCAPNAGAASRVGRIEIVNDDSAQAPVVVRVYQPGTESGTDSDGDGLTDEEEYGHGSNPDIPDTDGDGVSDGNEAHLLETSTVIADTDGDGLSDGDELAGSRDPLTPEQVPEEYRNMVVTANGMTRQMRVNADLLTLDDLLKQAAEYLGGQSNVATVHYTPGTEESSPELWAEFTNDIKFVVMVKPIAGYDPSSRKKAAPAPLAAPEKAFLSQGFPENECAFANLFDANTNVANTGDLIAMVENKNYTVQSITGAAGGVEFFKTLATFGMVYLDTHGGFFVDNSYVTKPTDPAGFKPSYAVIQTGDVQNAAQDQQYTASGDFTAARVMIGAGITEVADLPLIAPGYHYCISNKFIETYVGQMEKHSLVFLNCCQTAKTSAGTPYTEAPLFIAFKAKNAGTILGWTESVSDTAAMKAGSYLFSRALGDNDAIDPQQPPIAPYSTPDAFGALVNRNYDFDPSENAQLVGYIRNNRESLLLTPRIKFLVPDLETKEMTLHGDFGDNGTPVVKAGDQVLTVKANDPDEILVDLPDQASGPVTVEMLNHKSNAVPLTQWKGTFELSAEAGVMTPGVSGTVSTRWRCDIHAMRDQFPEDEAKLPEIGIVAMEPDSTFTWNFNSSHVADKTLYEYSGEGSVQYTLDPEGNTWYGGSHVLYLADNRIQFALYAVAELTTKITDLESGAVQEYTLPFTIPISADVPISQYGTISGGETSVGAVRVSWTGFEVTGAPDEQTPAP